MPTQLSVFHVDLSHGDPTAIYTLHADGRRLPLRRHDEDSLAGLALEAPEMVAGSPPTHTSGPVTMSADAAIRVHVSTGGGDVPRLVQHAHIHVPAAGAIDAHHHHHHHHKMDWEATARTFLFHHPGLITGHVTCASIIVNEHMWQDPAKRLILELARKMQYMQLSAGGWYTLEPVQYDSGHGSPQLEHMHQVKPEVTEAAGPALTSLLTTVSNDERLKGKKWRQAKGFPVVEQGGSPPASAAAEIAAADIAGDDWKAALTSTHESQDLRCSIRSTGDHKAELTMRNYGVRYLCAYIQFVDADDQPVDMRWWNLASTQTLRDALKGLNSSLRVDYDDLRLLGLIDPQDTIFAIPTYEGEGTLTVDIDFSRLRNNKIVGARIYGCGLAANGDLAYPRATALGGLLTGVCNFTIPVFMLAFSAAAQTYKPLYKILKDKKVMEGLFAVGVAVYAGLLIKDGASEHRMNWRAATSLVKLLITGALKQGMAWVTAQIATDTAVDEIPFAGWAMLALDVATAAAQMAESIHSIVISDWMIENEIKLTIDSEIILHPDPRHKAWPAAQEAANVTARLVYKSKKRSTVERHIPVPRGDMAAFLSTTFTNILGGHVRVDVDYQIGGWVAGKATSGWLPNDQAHLRKVTLWLVQFPVPLTKHSVYTHNQLLEYQENLNGPPSYLWQPTREAPTATIYARNASGGGHAISEWSGLALSQRHAVLAWAWKAAGMSIPACDVGAEEQDDGTGQLFATMTASIPDRPMTGIAFSDCGLQAGTSVVVDAFPAKFLMKGGQWVIDPKTHKPEVDPKDVSWGAYYLDSRPAALPVGKGGGHHLRRIRFSGDQVEIPTGGGLSSWGRFPSYAADSVVHLGPPSELALHPSGHVIAVNKANHKLYVLPLPKQGCDDVDAPIARGFAGRALNYRGSGGRAGLLLDPVAVTCTSAGVILVLESVNRGAFQRSRLQAFDMHGNPASVFSKGKEATPFFDLPTVTDPGGEPIRYLDLTSVGSSALSFVFVLSYTGDGSHSSQYHMGIYRFGSKLKGAPGLLVTTPGMAAARIAVDMWHTIYTLNWAMVGDQAGHQAGPSNRTVPSLSEWLPPIPSSES